MSIVLNGDTGINTPTYGGTDAAEYLVPVTAFKNRIINGSMAIDQRNAGASVTPTNGQYTLDRWQALLTQTSKYSVQQNAGSITPPIGFVNYLGATSLSAYSVVSSDYFVLRQMIEGLNVADLGWGTANAATVTLSFWVRSSLTGTFGGSVGNEAGNRSYPFTYTISSANTWEQKTVTIAGDTTGTWLTNNSVGLRIYFSIGSGSTFSGAAGSWTANNFVSATGATSVVGTNGATFYITGVQLEKGSTATSFDYRPYGQELALCQRYFEKSYNTTVAPATATDDGRFIFLTGTATSGIIAGNVFFAVEKRSAPTITSYDASGNSGKITALASNGTPTQNVTASIGFGETGTRATRLAHSSGSNAGIACQWIASAEL